MIVWTRRQKRARLRPHFEDFMGTWQDEMDEWPWPDGLVPGHRLFVTGITLWELLECGLVETDGFGWRPAK